MTTKTRRERTPEEMRELAVRERARETGRMLIKRGDGQGYYLVAARYPLTHGLPKRPPITLDEVEQELAAPPMTTR